MPKSKFAIAVTVKQILAAAERVTSEWTPEVGTEMERCARAYVHNLRKLAAASSKDQRRRRLHQLYTGMSAKICAFALAYDRGRPLTWRTLKRRALELNVRQGSGSLSRAWSLLKPDGSYRTITRPSLDAKVRSLLVLHALKALLPPNPYDFCQTGRGRDKALKHLVHNINQGGIKHLVLADVKDCFGSITIGMVATATGLPLAIIQNSIFMSPDDPLTADRTHKPQISEFAMRARLPQGLPASSLVASKVIEPLLQSIGLGFRMSYLDNLILGAATPEKAQAIKDALAAAFEQHPAASLKLKYIKTFRFGLPYDILGMWVRRQARQFGGGARLSPSPRTIHREERKLLADLIVSGDNVRENVIDAFSKAFALRSPLWGGRMNGGQTTFETGALDRLLKPARRARAEAKRLGLTFGSFKDFRGWARAQAANLKPDPLYYPAFSES